MPNRAEHRRNVTKNPKQAQPKQVGKIYAFSLLICFMAILAGVWHLSMPSTAQGQVVPAQATSPHSATAPLSASLASFALPQTPPNASVSPASVPTSPRRETDLILDLSQGGSEFDENLIVPASKQAVLADGRIRLVGLLKPGDCLRMSGQRLALVRKAQTSLYTPPPPEKPDKDGLTSHRVIGTVKHLADTLLYLRTSDELIKTTPEHPFFVHGKGWTQAGKLQQGDQIETALGQLVPVVSTQVRHERMMVYNLEVEGAHDFFVGKDKLLVHNGGDCVPDVVSATFDEAYTLKRHTAAGSAVMKALAKGDEAHIFNDGTDLADLANKVWTEGEYAGNIRGWDRFVWNSPTPIGMRVQAGRASVPLSWVEIKVNSGGLYHLVPRTGPAR